MRLVLWCLFGMSGWWAYNSIMAELPIFVATLPGHERIGSVLVLCTQVGAVLTLAILNPLYLSCRSGGPRDNGMTEIHALQSVALVALLGTACFWQRCVYGEPVPLFVLTVSAGAVGSFSDTVFWTFANQFPPACIQAMSVGTALAGWSRWCSRSCSPLFRVR